MTRIESPDGVANGYDHSWVSNRSIGFLALGVVAVLLAGALLVVRSDSVEGPVQARADGVRAESDTDQVPRPSLEMLEPSSRESRTPVPENRPQATEASGDLKLGDSVVAVPIYPVELRTLPEFNLAEMMHKRDAIQEHLTRLTEPLLEQRFREGKFERLSYGMERRYAQPGRDYSEISSTRRGTEEERDGAVTHFKSTLDRTALPRSEYPEFYVMRDDVERLNRSIQECALADYYERKAAQAMEAAR